MASFKGLYDKLISIIKTDTVVNSGAYTPSATDIIPVYDYQNAVDSATGEKIATKKFVRATDLGGGGSPSTEIILHSNLTVNTYTNEGEVRSFTIPAYTVPANSMLYLECRAFSASLVTSSNWAVDFKIDSLSFGQSGTNPKLYTAMLKFANINSITGLNNVTVGPLGNYPIDYVGATVQANKHTIDWTLDQTITLNLSGPLPAGGVAIQMFRIKLATETPTP